MTLLTPALKVGIVVRRHPETEDVFEWHDIDVTDRRHATLEEIAEDLDLEIETLLDELGGALLDDPDDEEGRDVTEEDDDDLDGEAFEVSEVDLACDGAFNDDEEDAVGGAAVLDDSSAEALLADVG